ncbi:sigma-70 family RNA polymerase sigma factor [Catenuloplanes atrovinosus]|uniref:RNA polymerase sigma factor (Sigma-70 family) n=1 Tax=Catenuloplanes atrovinosus TaxID=137266 RepID=A0AAE3YR66_9ACTN|nr:sigma-70 family RNA polymerase sigma factor [Catenuloplanes atrovinosus]MDR7278483.1 RNA polymerase sigma factor (sigma-70 family) [Catenuloplanes atrovinosus]
MWTPEVRDPRGPVGGVDPATVRAAREGNAAALDRVVAAYLPLVYNIVGRALQGHADVDDVVQETMLRVVHNLPELRDPAAFRSWVVAIAMRLVRDRHRDLTRAYPADATPDDVADPGADFVDLTIVRLGLSGQRQEVAQATRWLDPDDRELLSLWWLESAGELDREDVAHALGLTRQHTAVRVQRMKAQLEAARVVVRALRAHPACPDLTLLAIGWDGRPEPVWRKRFARHTRECDQCARAWHEMVDAERLLAGLALVPIPGYLLEPALHGAAAAAGHEAAGGYEPVHGYDAAPAPDATVQLGAAPPDPSTTATHVLARPELASAGQAGAHAVPAKAAFSGLLGLKPLAAALATAAVVTAGGVFALTGRDEPVPAAQEPPPAAVVPVTSESPSPSPSPSASASPSPSPSASPTPSATPPAQPKPIVPAAVAASSKKGVSTWQVAGVGPGMTAVGASWYYTWGAGPDQVKAPSGVEFVPMIWGRDSVNAGTLAQAKANGETLLGFNEPDLGEQANMTVEQALELWPQLQATGMRLGSPAVAYGGDTAGGWLDRFMAGAKAKGYRVDFIALHWYGSDFSPAAVGHLEGYIKAVHDRYKLPIWVTEYGLINFAGSPKFPSGAQQAAFIDGSTAMMEGLPYVERYAWFSLPVADDFGNGLYDPNAKALTEGGRAYAEAG